MTHKPIDVQKFTQRRVTVPIVMILGVLVLGWRMDGLTVDYLDNFFITKVQAEEQFEIITKQVAATEVLLVSHISEYKLNENAKEIRGVEDAIYDLELYVAANQASQLTRDRGRDLQADLSRLKRVRECIVRDDLDENCSAII